MGKAISEKSCTLSKNVRKDSINAYVYANMKFYFRKESTELYPKSVEMNHFAMPNPS